MTVISKSEFAARRGWAKSYVSKLANQGRLVLNEDDKIELEATEALLLESADPSKAAVAKRHERLRLKREESSADETPMGPLIGLIPDFQKSRALREHYLSLQEQANFHKSQGTLVEREAVELAAYAAGRMLRDLLLGMAAQLAPELASMTDPWEIERRLTSAVRRSLNDAERMSSADLDQALTI
jgi:hypothetical protein